MRYSMRSGRSASLLFETVLMSQSVLAASFSFFRRLPRDVRSNCSHCILIVNRKTIVLLALRSESLRPQHTMRECCQQRRARTAISAVQHIAVLSLLLTVRTTAGGTPSRRSQINIRTASAANVRHPSTLTRGGSSYNNQPQAAAAPTYPSYDNNSPPANEYRPSSQFENSEQYYEPPATSTEEPNALHETVQERLDTWKAAQLVNAARYQESLRDEQGRVKLLTSVGKGSRAAIFFFLVLRDLHLYERAALVASAPRRLFFTVPLIFLFLANMVGVAVSMASPSHVARKRLKAILNLDKVVEVLLVLYAVVRLTIWPNKYAPREVYVGHIFHSAVFLLQCQAFTRLSWDDTAGQPMSTYATVSQQRMAPTPQASMPPAPRSLGNEEWYEPRPIGDTRL